MGVYFASAAPVVSPTVARSVRCAGNATVAVLAAASSALQLIEIERALEDEIARNCTVLPASTCGHGAPRGITSTSALAEVSSTPDAGWPVMLVSWRTLAILWESHQLSVHLSAHDHAARERGRGSWPSSVAMGTPTPTAANPTMTGSLWNTTEDCTAPSR
jgi:hypothetical protein